MRREKSGHDSNPPGNHRANLRVMRFCATRSCWSLPFVRNLVPEAQAMLGNTDKCIARTLAMMLPGKAHSRVRLFQRPPSLREGESKLRRGIALRLHKSAEHPHALVSREFGHAVRGLAT